MYWDKLRHAEEKAACTLPAHSEKTKDKKGEYLMAVEYNASFNQRIDWGALASLQTVQTKTFIFVINRVATGEIFILSPAGATDEEWGFAIGGGGALLDRLTFYSDWSTAQGQWRTTDALSTGINFLAISYDYGSTSNDPVMYVNGSSVAVTEYGTPSGTYRTGTSNSARLGGNLSLDGTIYNFLVYNRILSATEILEAYNSRLAIPNRNGLVFAPHLSGAAGLTTFDGSTLAAGNTIADQVSGALGVPAGSPVGRSDVYLTYQD
jgi:hypothetical protein